MVALTEGLISVREFGLTMMLPALLVFVIIYAILAKTKVLGENQWIDMIVAVVTAIVFVSVAKAVEFTNEFLPLIAMAIVVLVFLFVVFRFVGVENLAAGGGKTVLTISSIAIVVVLASVAFSKVFTSAYDTGTSAIGGAFAAFWQAIIDPPTLAVITLFGSFIAVAYLIARK